MSKILPVHIGQQLDAMVYQEFGRKLSGSFVGQDGKIVSYDDGSVFFARQLELIEAGVYKVQYPELKAKSLFPVDNQGGPWVNQITTRYFNRIGSAKIGSGAVKNIPRADIVGGEFSVKVVPITSAFGYDWLEIQRAMKLGISLEADKGEAVMWAYEKKLNDVVFSGDTESGITGLFNAPDVAKGYVAASGTGSTDADKRLAANKTGAQMVADVQALLSGVYTNSNGVERANTVLVTPAFWILLNDTIYDSQRPEISCMQYLMNNNIFLKNGGAIVDCLECVGAGTGGVDVMVAYTKDIKKVRISIPMGLNFFPVQQDGLEFFVPSLGLTAGLNFRYPKSAQIAEGM